jgi:glycosyltransferase involved in cell wall biosynthesis
VPPEKLHVVAEWADPDLFHPTEPDQSLAAEHGLTGKFNIVYGGTMGPAQGLATVLDAAKLLVGNSRVQFVLIGDGSELEALRRRVATEQISNVKFLGRQPMESMHQFFALADVLLVHLIRKPIFALQLPSKVLAYLACGRPILCAVQGTAEQTVLDAGAGMSCPSEDPVALAERVREFSNMSAIERQQMGERGRQAYLSNYSRQVQVARVEQILESVVHQTMGRQIAA